MTRLTAFALVFLALPGCEPPSKHTGESPLERQQREWAETQGNPKALDVGDVVCLPADLDGYRNVNGAPRFTVIEIHPDLTVTIVRVTDRPAVSAQAPGGGALIAGGSGAAAAAPASATEVIKLRLPWRALEYPPANPPHGVPYQFRPMLAPQPPKEV